MSPSYRGKLISEGKAKCLYESRDSNEHIIQFFKDDATAFNGEKKGSIAQKGRLNNEVSALLFSYLAQNQIPNHFVEKLSPTEMRIKKLKMIPVEVVVRNLAAGSLCKRLGTPKGFQLSPPLVEFFYKHDGLGDPLIGESHIFHFGWATADQLNQMVQAALKTNTLLLDVFKRIGLQLVDFKLEFGLDSEHQVLLGDEFTPDGCRLWDLKTGESMDKDRFRHDLGQVSETYLEVHNRLVNFFKGE